MLYKWQNELPTGATYFSLTNSSKLLFRDASKLPLSHVKANLARPTVRIYHMYVKESMTQVPGWTLSSNIPVIVHVATYTFNTSSIVWRSLIPKEDITSGRKIL